MMDRPSFRLDSPVKKQIGFRLDLPATHRPRSGGKKTDYVADMVCMCPHTPSFKDCLIFSYHGIWLLLWKSGLEIGILQPGAISLKIARKLLLVHLFVHKFI